MPHIQLGIPVAVAVTAVADVNLRALTEVGGASFRHGPGGLVIARSMAVRQGKGTPFPLSRVEEGITAASGGAVQSFFFFFFIHYSHATWSLGHHPSNPANSK